MFSDLWLFLSGFVAAGVNAAAGGGTLLSFPALIAAGLSPIAANATSTVGLLPGMFASTGGYWRELSSPELRKEARLQIVPAALGGVLGAWLLLHLGGRVFARVVPVLLLAASALLAAQPLVARWLGRHRPQQGSVALAMLIALATSTYGGYFGAGQGIIFLAAMGLVTTRPIGEVNALKVLVAMVNSAVAAITFVMVEAWHPTGALDFRAALPLCIGSFAGGWLGARVARRLPAPVLRGFAAGVGVAIGLYLALRR